MKTLLNRSRAAMTLVEIVIVVVILGVVLGAVLLLLTRGTDEYYYSRMQNELDIAGRQALDAMTDAIVWAGYMPDGGWDDEDWHPVVTAEPAYFEFFADWDPTESLDSTDFRQVRLLASGYIQITDLTGDTLSTSGECITDLQFTYLDENGVSLGSSLPSQVLRDRVRHIQIRIELTSTYSDYVYQTWMQTTVSPRNLGLNHDINPNLYGPDDLQGHIVFNIADQDSIGKPTIDEELMIDRLSFWGYTLTLLTDYQLESYDYTDINLLILRHMPVGSVHPNPNFYRTLPIPIITMNGLEAANTFGMGTVSGVVTGTTMNIIEPDHPVHSGLTTPPDTSFTMYTAPMGFSYLGNFNPGTFFLTEIAGTTQLSGLCVVNDSIPAGRRIHYSPWVASKYTEGGGWRFFYNVINWAAYHPDENPGTPLTELEDFEGPKPADITMNLFEDPLIPSMVWDTTVVWSEDFQNMKDDGVWEFIPGMNGRCDVITAGVAKYLRMDRSSFGTGVRNTAVWTTDLSGFDEYTDELIFRMDTFRGQSEGDADSMDGVFFRTVGTAEDTLLTQDFEGMRGHGDIQFWGDLYGRYTIHNPSGWFGDGDFVTFDTRVSGQPARNRLMIEAATTGYSTGDQVTVDYRFHDHMDNTDSGAASYLDFLGWNATGRIDDDYNLIENLDPESWSDFDWFDRSASFTPSVLPDPIYILFGQYGYQSATGFSNNGGISLDNITVSISGLDSVYTKIADPGPGSGWEQVVVDLDDAAIANGVSFGSDFGLVLSQYGFGPWTGYGRCWDNLQICALEEVLSIPGWSHESLYSSSHGYDGADDWSVEEIIPGTDYCWGLRANSSSSYSDSSFCYLQTPLMTIPSTAFDVQLSFRHNFLTPNENAGGWVQIQVDGGGWTDFTGLTYTGVAGGSHPAPNGTQIYYGSSGGWQTETADLSLYAGHDVELRFVFGADHSYTGGNWQIDDLTLTAQVTAWEITAVSFEATTFEGPAWNWTFDDVDIYMKASADSIFTGGGEWDKSDMTLVVSDYTFSVFSPDWWTINLDTPFYLPEGMNLHVKIEKADSTTSNPYHLRWATSYTPNYHCRRTYSDTSDPTYLPANNYLACMLLETTTGEIGLGEGTDNWFYQPVNSFYLYSDFEGIYTPGLLGTTGNINWTHGGDGDDWDFGEPQFVPNIDPWLLPQNGTAIAGTDLAVDGYYENDAWAWLVSPAYPMPDSCPTLVTMRLDRCIRMAPGDEGYVFVGFSDTQNPPTSETDWLLIRSYPENQTVWDTEDIVITPEFEDAFAATPAYSYYFLRFVLSSNLTSVRGGMNIDNIQIFGDAE
jgi:type II secretory pathway pseudopilin PulG